MNSQSLVRVAVVLLLVGSVADISFAQPASVYPREDIRTFSKSAVKVAKLRNAVEALQQRKPDNATSWLNMANIHGYPGNLPTGVPPAVTALYAQCHRKEEMFFLWHRAYVWALERLMQDAIGDSTFRLPYWDWYSDPVLPEIFRNEWLDAQHTKKNFLYVADRKPTANGGRPVWQPKWVTDFNESQFGRFQRSLNFSEHGSIHMAVGTPTNMGHPTTAARDPIFWLHHANIDRLLPVWKKIGSQHVADTNYPDWKPETYRFPVPSWTMQNPTTTTPTVDELALNASNEMMGYTYENTDLPRPAAARLPVQPQAVKSTPVELPGAGFMMRDGTEALSSHRDIEIGAGGTVKLKVGSRAGNKLMQLAQPREETAPPPMVTTIVLSNVTLVKADENVLSYEVYLNLPVNDGSKERFHDHFLGSVSLFMLNHGDAAAHHMDEKSSELRFEATKALSASIKSAGTAPAEVSVSLVPVLAPDSKAPETTVLKIGEIKLETSVAQR